VASLNRRSKATKSPLIGWLLGYLRFGLAPVGYWRPYHQFGSSDCPTAFLVIGGLSSNGSTANRQLARSLHRTWRDAHTWSRNLSGHTGHFFDYSGSRFWHWISDGLSSLHKLIHRYHKSDIVLIGHSTGGLVVLCLAILYRVFRRSLVPKEKSIRLRCVLIFPAFRLKRRRDAILLSIVGVLYYLVCPAAFLLLALSGPWMWPMSLLAFVLHIVFVPQISVPSGEERARQEAAGRRWFDMPEGVVLGLACIYFVAAPPLIAALAGVFPGSIAQAIFAVFILTLLTPIFLMPREIDLSSIKATSRIQAYQWMPIITVTNLIILQRILRPILGWVQCPVLIFEAGLDEVVQVPSSWVSALGDQNVRKHFLYGFPHSSLSVKQQIELSDIIVDWCRTG
jgi:pimeloyl-ACP methyl ester carboxylesterase